MCRAELQKAAALMCQSAETPPSIQMNLRRIAPDTIDCCDGLHMRLTNAAGMQLAVVQCSVTCMFSIKPCIALVRDKADSTNHTTTALAVRVMMQVRGAGGGYPPRSALA